MTVLLHRSYALASPSAHCYGTKSGNSLLQPLVCLHAQCSSKVLAMPFQICGSKLEVTAVSEQPWLPPHPGRAFFLLCWQSRLTPCMWLPHHPLPTTGFWSCTTEATYCMGKFVTLQAESPSKHFPFSPSSHKLSPQHTSAPTHSKLCLSARSLVCALQSYPANTLRDILQSYTVKGCPSRLVIGKETQTHFCRSSWKLQWD